MSQVYIGNEKTANEPDVWMPGWWPLGDTGIDVYDVMWESGTKTAQMPDN